MPLLVTLSLATFVGATHLAASSAAQRRAERRLAPVRLPADPRYQSVRRTR